MDNLLAIRKYLQSHTLSGQLPKTQGKRTDLPFDGNGSIRDNEFHQELDNLLVIRKYLQDCPLSGQRRDDNGKFPELQNFYGYIEQLEEKPVTGYKVTWRWVVKEILPEHENKILMLYHRRY